MVQNFLDQIKTVSVGALVRYTLLVITALIPFFTVASYVVRPLAQEVMLDVLKKNGLDPDDLSGLKSKMFEVDKQTDNLQKLITDIIKQSLENGKEIEAVKSQGIRIEVIVDKLLTRAINKP